MVSYAGLSSAEAWSAAAEGRSGVEPFAGGLELPEGFVASRMNDSLVEERFARLGGEEGRYTRFEKALICAVAGAAEQAGADMADPRTLLVISTTKGNVELLDERCRGGFDPQRVFLWSSARLVAEFFGSHAEPLVVSNACISGAAAQIAAMRELEAGRYERAVVAGADVLSRFVVSGFQSFKALSDDVCRPFDRDRRGLNLGEAAAAIVYERRESPAAGDIVLEAGAIRNDANHISGPSRTGEGLYNALAAILGIGREGEVPALREELAFVSAHGTATPYNDEMESIALHRAGLDGVPAGSLKSCFGHTLGAAGVVESIVSMRALREGLFPGTGGYANPGTSWPQNVSSQARRVAGSRCVKMLSGFGGCNAALLFRKIG